MSIFESYDDCLSQIAQAADFCLKPWKHSVLLDDETSDLRNAHDDFLELIVRIECRDVNGERHPENDLEIEIFPSGEELNITLAWHQFPLRPILWQGKHSLWMDAQSGKKSVTPIEGDGLEALARRLRSLFQSLYQ